MTRPITMPFTLDNGAIIRPLQAQDNAALAAMIREVSAEYGLTADRGLPIKRLTV
jgi:putative acetyltransferase